MTNFIFTKAKEKKAFMKIQNKAKLKENLLYQALTQVIVNCFMQHSCHEKFIELFFFDEDAKTTMI